MASQADRIQQRSRRLPRDHRRRTHAGPRTRRHVQRPEPRSHHRGRRTQHRRRAITRRDPGVNRSLRPAGGRPGRPHTPRRTRTTSRAHGRRRHRARAPPPPTRKLTTAAEATTTAHSRQRHAVSDSTPALREGHHADTRFPCAEVSGNAAAVISRIERAASCPLSVPRRIAVRWLDSLDRVGFVERDARPPVPAL